MLKNDVCPYCTLPLNKDRIQNHPRAASTEHLIPNTALKVKRTKNDGEFQACRTCNLEKGKLDEVFGMLGKIQSKDEDFAIESMTKALEKKNNKRLIDMFFSAREWHNGDVLFKLPMEVEEIATYCTYLAKGAYFLQYGKPLKCSKYLILFDLFSNLTLRTFEENYKNSNGALPFDDLKQNPNTSIYANGQFLIYQKNNAYMFVIHNSFAVTLDIVPRTMSNFRKRKECFKRLS